MQESIHFMNRKLLIVLTLFLLSHYYNYVFLLFYYYYYKINYSNLILYFIYLFVYSFMNAPEPHRNIITASYYINIETIFNFIFTFILIRLIFSI